jgi:predicted nuclease of predicted toxin-antitoxin system
LRFLPDQDVYAVTCRLLRGLGHDVAAAADLNLSRSPDTGLLMRAAEEKRLFVTRDKDYGGLVFVERLSKGVLYLRISPETLAATHEELKGFSAPIRKLNWRWLSSLWNRGGTGFGRWGDLVCFAGTPFHLI